MGRATGKNNPDLGALQLLQGLFGTLGSAARGSAAATLGFPGDLESLVRMLPGLDEKTWLPTTKDVASHLPNLPPSLQQPTIESVSQFAPLTPAQALKVGQAGKGALTALADRAMMPPRAIAQAGAIRPKGGNWNNLPSQRWLSTAFKDITGEIRPERLKQLREETGYPTLGILSENLGKFLKGPLNNYIRREMGTPDDTLVRLADQGITHAEDFPDVYSGIAYNARKLAGMPTDNLATTPLGKKVEDIADLSIKSNTVGPDFPESFVQHPELLDKMWDPYYTGELYDKWRLKDPTAKEYSLHSHVAEDLKFDELLNQLARAAEPTEDIPQHLRLRPDQIGNMSFERAVRHVSKLREAEEAQAELTRLEQLASEGHMGEIHKTYPSGHKWVRMSLPTDTSGYNIREAPHGMYEALDKKGNVIKQEVGVFNDGMEALGETPEEAALMAQILTEGNRMGHCVGNYCGKVKGGSMDIYSLRSPDGESHVTISTRNPDRSINWKPLDKKGDDWLADEFYDLTGEDMWELRRGETNLLTPAQNEHIRTHTDDAYDIINWLNDHKPELVPDVLRNDPGRPHEIDQIKFSGKKDPNQSRRPGVDDWALPYIQDFVSSKNWDEVGDLSNAGLVDLKYANPPVGMRASEQEFLDTIGNEIKSGKRYITEDEFSKLFE